jgi:Tol biopolymer transport system component
MLRLVATAVVALVATAAAASTSAPPPRGSILFASTRAADLHDEIWLLDTRSGTRRNLSRHPTSDRLPAPSPDGKSIAFVSDREGAEAIWLVRPSGGKRRLAGPFRDTRIVHWLVWSPDGDALAFLMSPLRGGASRMELWLVSTSGHLRRLLANVAHEPAWSPDGNTLAVTHASGTSGSIRDRRGRLLRRFAGAVVGWSSRGELAIHHGRSIVILGRGGGSVARTRGYSAWWHPDGSLLAVNRQTGLAVVHRRGGQRFFKPGLTAHAWSPDGRLLSARNAAGQAVLVTFDGAMRRVDGASGALWSPSGELVLARGAELRIRTDGRTRRLRLPQRPGSCPATATWGGWLGRHHLVYEFGSGGQQTSGLWVASPSGGAVRRFRADGNRWSGSPQWSPNGDRVVYEEGPVLTHGGGCSSYDNDLRLAQADGSGGAWVTAEADGPAVNPRWSPDGRYIAYEQESLSEESEFGIFVADTAASNRKTRLSRGRSAWPSWTADSRSVVFETYGDLRSVVVATGATTPLGRGETPEAAPSAPLVAFIRGRELWTSTLDGSASRRITEFRPFHATGPPRWSPDSRRLALIDTRGVVIADRVTGDVRVIRAPDARNVEWSPDGRTLSFARVVGTYSRGSFSAQLWPRSELYVVAAAGGKPRRLTRDFANVGWATWRP